MEKKTFRICAAIMAAVLGALIWLNCAAERGPKPDKVIPMANAGSNGPGPDTAESMASDN